MTEALYLKDSYLNKWDAKVVEVKDGKFIVLDQTAFYPSSGGQPHDTGTIVAKSSGEKFNVIFVGKFDGVISHEVDKAGLEIGDKVSCEIDWKRRYALMKAHTSMHLFTEVIFRESRALVTGNQLDVDKCRVDLNLERYDLEEIKSWVEKTNEVMSKDLKVSVKFLPREEAMKIPQLSKLATNNFLKNLSEVRIVNIGEFDVQADGGTHVKSTEEIGKMEFIRCDNKGKNNRRIYYRII